MTRTRAKIHERPSCDLCGTPATIDGKTRMGPWAYMCDGCHTNYGVGLGTGKGQILDVAGDR